MSKQEIPQFTSEDDELVFWATHDTADYFDFSKAQPTLMPNLRPTLNPFHTRITDLLDAAGIPYRWLLHGEPVFTVEAAARQRGVRVEEMVKSILLCDRSGHYVMACVPGAARVDPKAVQAALGAGWRRLHFASSDEILAVTGCVQGAVTPIGLPYDVPVLFDEAIGRLAQCNISSGDPRAGLELAAADLIRMARGQVASIAASG